MNLKTLTIGACTLAASGVGAAYAVGLPEDGGETTSTQPQPDLNGIPQPPITYGPAPDLGPGAVKDSFTVTVDK